MSDELDRDAQLDEAEREITAAVADALAATADEFADAVGDATELVAARFSVGRIARMWGARTAGLIRRLLGVAETAATAAAEDTNGTLPDGWDDLPGRYDDRRALPPGIGQYVETTEHLLRAVGDRLAEAARRELAAGVDAGEDIEQLRARLRSAFDREGSQLGPMREERVARTEATRAWNTSTLAAARAATGPDRPVVKQWLTRHDDRVRHAHAEVDGQIRLIADPFTVAGVSMQAPGDATAPPAQVVNCRCRLAVAPEQRAAASQSQVRPTAGIPDQREKPVTAAAAPHTGAMIALMPCAEDAERLALDIDGAEPAHELHLTLFYLGEGADWADDQRADLIDELQGNASYLDGPVYGRAFGTNQWNADGDSPCWVWAVGDDPDSVDEGPLLNQARNRAVGALENTHRQPELPAQHSPWQPHVCAAYSDSSDLLAAMNARLGPIRFDRLRVAFAGEYTDIPLGSEEEAPPMEEETPLNGRLSARPWSTPGDTGLAFENTETGDGRVFRPDSLYWDGPGPWPLQHADEMLMGHEGAELAGAIQSIARDGDRITGTGVLYPGRPAGADALMLLEEDAPLGVSVDLDDVSMEFVDRTLTDGEDDEGEIVLFASLPSASLLRLSDGSWSLTATTTAEWTASGAALSRTATGMHLLTGNDGRVPRTAVQAALGPSGCLTAAAGDSDSDAGTVVHSESAGDLLMRVTRARLRGATLVAMPAYDRARIVLDDAPEETGDDVQEPDDLAAAMSEAQRHVVDYVRAAPVPVGPRDVARALGMKMETARGHLGRAAQNGRVVRLSRGLYIGPSTQNEELAADAYDDPSIVPPWTDEDGEETAAGMRELEASAWSAMREADPMPAAWFREPTDKELPPGSGGVHYADGRVYGWVAQAGEPHAGFPGRNLTIESLGELDLSHFLRARFRLDDGTLIKAGAFTMNVPHHRDGAECESAACQFDDSRTVAGIVTVGMNKRGLWFSGAAAPWLSEWDRNVFAACQPSYHMKQAGGGRWQLRAVLTVPVPGHSSPLLATAVAERSNLALAASAAGVALDQPDTSGHVRDTDGHAPDTGHRAAADLPGQRPDTSGHAALGGGEVDAVASALLTSVPFIDVLLTALDRRQEQRDEAARAEAAQLASSVIDPARASLTASAATDTTASTEGDDA
ncbi:phage minor head protein [Streptomyces sp. NBC_00120]|uniref:phage minor head protein n=1 Tax=Streptomyces sp. NBC_00120 TaxID=2975660 RepID=UPI002256FE53|nr:phage minor head protein [Streptomyces sp. NBC_00120]MCX5326286.1 phage minor head protein [Streptomyces sp. NBC_00120]